MQAAAANKHSIVFLGLMVEIKYVGRHRDLLSRIMG